MKLLTQEQKAKFVELLDNAKGYELSNDKGTGLNQLRNALECMYTDEEAICDIWCVDDVKSLADDGKIEITDEDARNILNYYDKHHDYVTESAFDIMGVCIQEYMDDKQADNG
jgi:hypothetical protein